MTLCDIHCHLLPGVDDGPADLDKTVAMLRSAWEGGTRTVVATPHLYADFFPNADLSTIRSTFATLTAEIERLAGTADFAFLGDLEIHLGAEHFCDSPFLEALGRGAVLPLAGTRYLLVEFPTRLPEQAVHAAAIRVLQAGYRPVLAHVERYAFVQHKPESLQRFIDMGCVVQVNADGSERFGGSPRLLRGLLRRGLVHVLATDAHGVRRRPPDLGPQTRQLTRDFSQAAIDGWTRDNPGRIVRGEAL